MSLDNDLYKAFAATLSSQDYAAALEMASNPNARQSVGPNGMTFLHVLAMHAHEFDVPVAKELLRTLIKNGVPVDAVDEDRRTALLLVQIPGSYWMIADLVAAGANPDWEGPGHFTSLFFNSFRLDEAGEILEALAQAGANPNWRHPKTGLTPLLVAAQSGRAKNMATLVRLGADLHLRTNLGDGILHILASAGHEAAIRQCAWLKVLVDQRELNGMTPLMLAALRGKTGTIAALLDAGANSALIDEDGRSAMDFADLLGDPELRMATQTLLRGN